MGFLPSEIARLVLGYLDHENCKDAYNAFLNSSPNLNECRERNLSHDLMGYSLVDILDEFGAIQIFLKKCNSAPLRTKLLKFRDKLYKIAFLIENAECLKPENCHKTTQTDIEDKSNNTEVECEDRSCQTDYLIEIPIKHCMQNVKQFETDVVNVTQNGVLPEAKCANSDVHAEVAVEENPILVTNAQLERLENHFLEMLKPGTIVCTENISQVPIEVVYLETVSQSSEHNLPPTEPCKLTVERLETMEPVKIEIESDGSECAFNVQSSDSESGTKFTSNLKLEFNCDMCHTIYEKKQDLEDHVNSTHSQRNLSTLRDNRNNIKTSNTENGTNIEISYTEEIANVYICDLCKKRFKRRYNILVHIKNTHERNNKKCKKCDAEFLTRYQLYTHTKKVHKLTNNTNEHKCEQCNRTFTLKYLHRIHMNEVHAVNEDRFHCKHCSRMFPTQLKLRKHVRYMHTDVGEYQCEFCSKIYVSKVQLKRHKQYSHSKDGSLVRCHHCRKRFGSVKQLTRHMREVHQNMPHKFLCQICSESFGIKKDLARHCLTKHPESLVEAVKSNNVPQRMGHISMKCSQCDKAFKSERQLEIHCTKSHGDGVKCKVCSKPFATSYRMQTHMTRSHSVDGVKFICVNCTKVFETKYQLTSHMVMAHGEKKFCCQICSKAFSLKRSLTRHMNEVHYRRGKVKKEVQ